MIYNKDAVSRKKIEKLKKWRFSYDTNTTIPKSDLFVKLTDIRDLPPVTPTHKKGKWEQYGNYWEDKFKCSACGKEQPKILCGERIIGHWSDYCPNCGAEMESEE